LAQSFPNDLEAHLERQSLDLLLQPITNLDNIGIGDLNAAGKGVCDAFAQITRKFPFNRNASQDVSLGELGDLLRPKTGRLWDTYEKKLKSVMTCENGKCTGKGSPPLNPVFLSSEEQLMRFSRALYGDSGTDPNLTYKMKALKSDQVTEFTITVNGQPGVKLKSGEDHSFQFPGPGTPGFKLNYTLANGGTLGEEEPPSTWAVFRFFFGADTVEPTQGGDTFTWKGVQGTNKTPILVGGKQLVYGFFVDTEVFSKTFLSNLTCVSKVTR
jgi:type VI protein secretion system component VasK